MIRAEIDSSGRLHDAHLIQPDGCGDKGPVETLLTLWVPQSAAESITSSPNSANSAVQSERGF